MSPSPLLHCGPAGWDFPHWDGLVYPRPRGRGFHPLRLLAGCFNALEINTSFYGPRRPEVSRLWLRLVAHNPDFLFTAKLLRRFTHERRLAEAELAAFKEGLGPLLAAGRLGCLLMQFPWSFRFTAENRDFFIRLRRSFHEFPLVAEMRHSSWMLPEAVGTFIDYHVGFCNIDQAEGVRAMPPAALLTTAIGYVRLHGRGARARPQDFEAPAPRAPGTAYLYSPAELEQWKERIDTIARFARAVFVITNNDARGCSVVNALQLQAMLTGERPAAPAGLVRRYPVELADFRGEGPMQQWLFESHPAAKAVA